MKRFTISLLCLTLAFVGQSQNKNTSLLGKLTYSSTQYGQLNDIWGHVDSVGNEYALVGARRGVSIVDVSDPTKPNEIFFAPGVFSVWRDLKTWDDHVYITNETSGGLMIIDLSNLPGAITSNDIYYYTGTSNTFTSAHNIYIDEKGFAYLFGSDHTGPSGNSSTIILDLKIDPKVPVDSGVFDTYYLHDGMVRGDTLWGGAIYQKSLAVVNVESKKSPYVMKTKLTSFQFTHNAWISDDGKTVFTTDEKSAAFVDAYDVSNFNNIEEIDRYQSKHSVGVIPHNTHVYGNFIVTSYYRDGVTIVDVTEPSVMVEVGNYDTSPLTGNGFNGCWGAYPYLPSGNLLASDMEEGLFVIGVDYVQGVYINGDVRAFSDSIALANAEVNTITHLDTISTNLKGYYKQSFPDSGFYRFAYSYPGYLPDTVDLFMKSGVLQEADIYLRKDTTFSFSGIVKSATDGTPIENALVEIRGKYDTYSVLTDSSGRFEIDSIYEGYYDISSGKWNYQNTCLSRSIVMGDSLIVELMEGLYEDFSIDNGWTVSGSASSGIWELKHFTPGASAANENYPVGDVKGDCFDFALVTGRSGTSNHDLDSGYTMAVSPMVDIRAYYHGAYLEFSYWFYNSASGLDDPDTLKVGVLTQSGIYWTFRAYKGNTAMKTWVDTVADISVWDTVRIVLYASDRGFDHIMEAAVDNISIHEYVGIEDERLQETTLRIYPNPVRDVLNISTDMDFRNARYQILNSLGQNVDQGLMNDSDRSIRLNLDQNGVYFLRIATEKEVVTRKFIYSKL